MQGLKICLIVRNPVDRLFSSYRMFGRDKTVSEFVDMVLNESNSHWDRQVDQHNHPDRLIRLESIESYIPDFPHAHISKGYAEGNPLVPELLEYYAPDFELWEAAEWQL